MIILIVLIIIYVVAEGNCYLGGPGLFFRLFESAAAIGMDLAFMCCFLSAIVRILIAIIRIDHGFGYGLVFLVSMIFYQDLRLIQIFRFFKLFCHRCTRNFILIIPFVLMVASFHFLMKHWE